MTDTCHSLPVCCALFHSDALPGIEKSRMCKEATPGSCLCCSPLSPQGRREQACNRELPLACCLLDCHSSERAVRPRWLEWVSTDMPSPCSCHAPCPWCFWLWCSPSGIKRALWLLSPHLPPLQSHLRGGDQSKSHPHPCWFKANLCHYFTAWWSLLCNGVHRSLSFLVLTPQQSYREKEFSILDEDLLQQFSSNQI